MVTSAKSRMKTIRAVTFMGGSLAGRFSGDSERAGGPRMTSRSRVGRASSWGAASLGDEVDHGSEGRADDHPEELIPVEEGDARQLRLDGVVEGHPEQRDERDDEEQVPPAFAAAIGGRSVYHTEFPFAARPNLRRDPLSRRESLVARSIPDTGAAQRQESGCALAPGGSACGGRGACGRAGSVRWLAALKCWRMIGGLAALKCRRRANGLKPREAANRATPGDRSA